MPVMAALPEGELPAGLDGAAIVAELAARGAMSLPFLGDGLRRALLAEAEGYPYQPSRRVVGSGENLVVQELVWFDALPESSLFWTFKDAVQALFDRAFAPLDPYPFATPLVFNEVMLQRYDTGSRGITPHRDHISYINLVCLFVLAGEGRFVVTADRAGRAPHAVDGRPGRAILMRAPGFQGSTFRPFHAVGDITATRYVFGLRHEDPPGAKAERARLRLTAGPEKAAVAGPAEP